MFLSIYIIYFALSVRILAKISHANEVENLEYAKKNMSKYI